MYNGSSTGFEMVDTADQFYDEHNNDDDDDSDVDYSEDDVDDDDNINWWLFSEIVSKFIYNSWILYSFRVSFYIIPNSNEYSRKITL